MGDAQSLVEGLNIGLWNIKLGGIEAPLLDFFGLFLLILNLVDLHCLNGHYKVLNRRQRIFNRILVAAELRQNGADVQLCTGYVTFRLLGCLFIFQGLLHVPKGYVGFVDPMFHIENG